MRVNFEVYRNQAGAEMRVTTKRRWVRFAVIYGTPPGSHIGFWRTHAGDLRGVNARLGRKIIGPCLTFLAHTRPVQ